MVIEVGTPNYPLRWGRTIRQMRELRGLTILELASELNITRQTVMAWESGRVPPSDRNRIMLARFFNVQPNVLFDLRMDDEPLGVSV